MKLCSLCPNESVIKQGHQFLCVRHYRLRQMRHKAKYDGKSAPSMSELETMIPDGMICPFCKKVMNWRRCDGQATVITIQHDRSGLVRMLCQSCNTRHAFFPGDTFYDHDQSKRRCGCCKLALPLDRFPSNRTCGLLMSKHNYCQTCCTQKHKVWRNKNRNRENAKQRAYYHKRKNSGNPIPRTARVRKALLKQLTSLTK